jgi:hypothetical protein
LPIPLAGAGIDSLLIGTLFAYGPTSLAVCQQRRRASYA